jgi:hypothetical protein
MSRKSPGQIAAEKQGAGYIRCAGALCRFTRQRESDRFTGYGKPIPSSVLTDQLKTGVIRTEEVLCNLCVKKLPKDAKRLSAPAPPLESPVCNQHTPAISV